MSSSNVSRLASYSPFIAEPRLSVRLIVTALFVALAFALTGCSSSFEPKLSGAEPGGPSGTVGSVFTGRLHGGQQPIAFADIFVFEVGESGYPGPGVQANQSIISATTPGSINGTVNGNNYGPYVTTDINGNFSFTLNNCRSGDGVYVVSYGGQAISGQTNSAASEMAAIGICDGSVADLVNNTPFVNVTEVSTVAFAYAMGGFTAAGYDFSHISTSATNIVGMQNAFNLAQQLFSVNTSGGANTTSSTLVGATFDAGKINLMANVLADCINSGGVAGSSSPCYTLLQNATSSGSAGSGIIPNDTASAMINITHFPLSNVSTITALANNSYAPYTPTSTTSANNLALTVEYSVAPATYDIAQLAIDGGGNVYGVGSRGPSRTVSPLIIKISPTSGYVGSVAQSNCGYLSLDQSNNVYFYQACLIPSTTTGVISKYAPSTTGVLGVGGPLSISGLSTGSYDEFGEAAGLGAPFFIGPANNILLTNATGNTVYNIPNSGGTSLAATSILNSPNVGAPSTVVQPGNGYAYITNYTGVDTTAVSVTTDAFAFVASNYIGYFQAADAFGDVWSLDTLNNRIIGVAAPGGSSSGVFAYGPALDNPAQMALDGQNILWITNGDGSACSVSSFGPTAPHYFFYYAKFPIQDCAAKGLTTDAIAVDESGNLWVAARNYTGNTINNGFVAEILGFASPTPQPLSLYSTKQVVGNTSSDLRP